MKKITTIGTLPKLPKRTRVAAYARVSDGKDKMLQSLAAQVNHYKNKIKNNPEWEFIGYTLMRLLLGLKT